MQKIYRHTFMLLVLVLVLAVLSMAAIPAAANVIS
jgi:hypothetical protein